MTARSRWITQSVASVSLLMLGAAAPARAQSVTWEVSSSFTITPGSGVVGPAAGRHFEHAWVREPARCGVDFTPAGQPETFDPFNADGLFLNQVINLCSLSNPFCSSFGFAMANTQPLAITPAGLSAQFLAQVPGPGSLAEGLSGFEILPYSMTGPVSGRLRSSGRYSAVAPPGGEASAYAFSAPALRLATGAASGTILWTPGQNLRVAGQGPAASYERIFLVPAGGEPGFEDQLLNVSAAAISFGGEASLTWTGDALMMTGDIGQIVISCFSPYAHQRGRLEITVGVDTPGVVATAERLVDPSAPWPWLEAIPLPAVGTSGPLVIPMPGPLSLGYTAPGPATLDLMTAGVSNREPSATCEADLNGDRLVDFGDYLEFLNLYGVGDPRADFNRDCFVDFADYLAFLNLYDAGC